MVASGFLQLALDHPLQRPAPRRPDSYPASASHSLALASSSISSFRSASRFRSRLQLNLDDAGHVLTAQAMEQDDLIQGDFRNSGRKA